MTVLIRMVVVIKRMVVIIKRIVAVLGRIVVVLKKCCFKKIEVVPKMNVFAFKRKNLVVLKRIVMERILLLLRMFGVLFLL